MIHQRCFQVPAWIAWYCISLPAASSSSLARKDRLSWSFLNWECGSQSLQDALASWSSYLELHIARGYANLYQAVVNNMFKDTVISKIYLRQRVHLSGSSLPTRQAILPAANSFLVKDVDTGLREKHISPPQYLNFESYQNKTRWKTVCSKSIMCYHMRGTSLLPRNKIWKFLILSQALWVKNFI